MAIFKCKMCGGDLEINEGVTVCDCDYCGTKQTVPTAKDENLHGLYNRANTLRIKAEFDKAEQLYEKILQADESQAEAYWGLILCKYGIEYVEDPATFKRMPTCHRASFDSIIADEDYKSALKYADALQKSIYEQEAKEIDRIQKEIIELSSKEEPYDVFICYKETDETGSRTQDSVIANDIYYQLTQEGFKVFYAAITLEDKLGSAYEPCIFAALNSAKVMLSIGTKPEYFNAVWVKNEWSRYLKIMKKDRSRLLIPCYKDMDAYELPEEFAHLQAQDMGKIGFINDIVRGIKKVIIKEDNTVSNFVTVNATTNIEPLLKRVFIFLEDGDWNSANEYCEKVLDLNPECAEAYLGKLMAETKVKTKTQLEKVNDDLTNYNNYKKAIKYANAQLCDELTNQALVAKNRVEDIYNRALKLMEEKNLESYKKARDLLNQAHNYKDSMSKLYDCESFIESEEERSREEKRTRDFEEAEKVRKKEFERLLPELRQKNKIVSGLIYAESYNTVLLNSKETCKISYVGEGSTVKQWLNYDNLIAIDNNGWQCDVALKTNGTVIVKGASASKYQRSNVSYWKDIVAIRSGNIHIVGLKSDGTVVAVGDNKYGQCNTSNWINIIAIETSHEGHTVGLKSDGTVVATGKNDVGQCNVSEWTEIIAIATMDNATLGLKADGTLVSVGDIDIYECDVDDWNGIISIDCRGSHIIGLKYDGTVVATGLNDYGQCDVEEWSNVVAVSTSIWHTVGLKVDGTLIATGRNNYGQCNVSSFKLFDDIDSFVHECEENLLKTKQKIEEERIAREKQIQIMSERRSKNVCQYCGGEFKKGLFSTKCVNCGKIKDY